MAVIELYINGNDFSDYIQQETDISERMRKIVGRAQDTAIDGRTIPDLLAVKWDPSFLLQPMPQAKMATLLALMKEETVALQYTSVTSGALRSITAMPVAMTVKYAMQWNSMRIYDATPISFEEV